MDRIVAAAGRHCTASAGAGAGGGVGGAGAGAAWAQRPTGFQYRDGIGMGADFWSGVQAILILILLALQAAGTGNRSGGGCPDHVDSDPPQLHSRASQVAIVSKA